MAAALGSVMWCCQKCSFSICESCNQGEVEWKVIAFDDDDQDTIVLKV
jgi:hypothetical protein